MAATTIERNATSIRPKAKRRTKATTGSRFDFSASAWSLHSAVCPVTPACVSGSAPTVSGTTSSRSMRKDAFEAASVPLPAIGTVMFATVPALVDVNGDRLERAAACERPSLELPDRLLHRRRLHARCLDDDVRGQCGARERLLHPVVGLDHLDRLGERLGPLSRETELQRRKGERHQQSARDDRRHDRPTKDAVDDRAPDPPFAVVAAEATHERDACPIDVVAEPREHSGKHGQRPEHRDGDDEDRGQRRATRRSSRRSGTCRPSPPSRSGPR